MVNHDQLAYRYEVLGTLGKGSFGQVLKCSDHKYKVLRAIKMIRNKRRFHQQALTEVKILDHLRDKVRLCLAECIDHRLCCILRMMVNRTIIGKGLV